MSPTVPGDNGLHWGHKHRGCAQAPEHEWRQRDWTTYLKGEGDVAMDAMTAA